MDERDDLENGFDQNNSSQEQNSDYIPKHEKAPEPPPQNFGGRMDNVPPYGQGQNFSRPGGYGQQQRPYGYGGMMPPPPPPRQYGQPQYGGYNNPPPRRYDDFMYEPIGFEELERRQLEQGAVDIKKKRSRGEAAAIILFVILILGSLGLAVFGIAHDVLNSKDAIDKLVDAKQIVLYRNSKPEGANDPENFKDENGKYTPEGVAELVRPSIVEIYTYETAIASKNGDQVGTGSGIVLSDDGYIVTNAHVLLADGYHTVNTVDGKVYPAKIIGRDVKTDIAVIKVDNAKLQPATLGDSDEAIVGEQVIAIGNPANLSSTVTDGIISAVNRKIKSDSTGFEMDCIQTNADISPGNSGGALVNMYGQVIGITSSKYVSSSFEGLGFAISINEAVPIMEQLIHDGYVGGRFRIGITLIDMSSENKLKAIEDALGFELPEDFEGIYIDSISDDADIKNTALKEGDFITEVNGKAVKTYDEFYDTISSQYGAGDTVPATCAHIDKDGKISYYDIKFKLMEDTSGNY
ncbi:MAG: trypsin-like peptidase domain-containing protein [Ruminococcus sp.]|jgi:serine protease Do|nr:trypsin-like peptidase domain-containing protein [Ruminococcus sp.]